METILTFKLITLTGLHVETSTQWKIHTPLTDCMRKQVGNGRYTLHCCLRGYLDTYPCTEIHIHTQTLTQTRTHTPPPPTHTHKDTPCDTTEFLSDTAFLIISYREKYSAWAGPAAVATTVIPRNKVLGFSVLAILTRALGTLE